MSFDDQIYAVAVRLAKYAQTHAAALQEELVELEARKRVLDAQLHTAKFAHERLHDFVPMRGNDFQCPRCWIEHETLSVLRPTSRGAGNTHIFECKTCEYAFTLRSPADHRAIAPAGKARQSPQNVE
jgi:DNA-directed RNA polymerase subunit M/transcription elongation factor TFIIS